ncbi:hypothetical protein GGR22_002489 [Flavobacterium gossypii]|uniref:Uncharacterized protein n=2 Tax=Flavobacterium TaxID=237 RepID=A0A495LZN3_9FLAO|nr:MULTISPECIES: hypothetical protein [Flavobacterium]MBA9074322.1 hypothetical protein [Flavobacterium gossypii]RKS19081.1 hypothetical protein CLV94_3032 [Flavobacterium endophyticum]WDO11573.1 hypothetical protein MH928_09540 [Flavobacterium sp. WW92]
MTIKKLLRFYPVIVIFGIFIYFHLVGKKNNEKFYKSKVNSLIVERNNWQVRATAFYLSNGLKIDSSSLAEFDLKLGDSIVKQKNTHLFKVYRRENSREGYYFLSEYDNNRY